MEKKGKKKGAAKKKAPKKKVVKKTAAKKKSVKKSAAKKATAKKTAAKKKVTKKAPAKKSAVKKTVAKKKAPAKKSAAKKATAKKFSRESTKGLLPGGEGSFTPNIDTSVSLDDWTNTEKVILSRRSVRVYKKKQIPEELVRRILECGRFAPSAGNCQPWRFAVVRDPKMLEEMENDIASALTIISKVIDVENAPWKKFHTRILQQLRPNQLHPIPMAMSAAMADGTFSALFEAPTLILLFKDKRGIANPDLDLGICGQNMIIAAHSMGLGTCWLGVVTALAFYKKWKRLFNIRHPWVLELGICMGYPVGEPNGFVHRDTQYTDWFDEDGHKVVF